MALNPRLSVSNLPTISPRELGVRLPNEGVDTFKSTKLPEMKLGDLIEFDYLTSKTASNQIKMRVVGKFLKPDCETYIAGIVKESNGTQVDFYTDYNVKEVRNCELVSEDTKPTAEELLRLSHFEKQIKKVTVVADETLTTTPSTEFEMEKSGTTSNPTGPTNCCDSLCVIL